MENGPALGSHEALTTRGVLLNDVRLRPAGNQTTDGEVGSSCRASTLRPATNRKTACFARHDPSILWLPLCRTVDNVRLIVHAAEHTLSDTLEHRAQVDAQQHSLPNQA